MPSTLAACLAGVAALGGTALWQHQRADEAGHEAREARADGDRMRPAGLMNPSRTDQSVPMTGSVGAASAVGVTLEPAGGSEQPTTPPIALLQLPA